MMIVDDTLEIQTYNQKKLPTLLLLECWTVKKEKDCEYRNVMYDRVLQLTQQILEMLKLMVILFQQARFQFSRLYMDHVWFMYGRAGRGYLLHRAW